MKKNSLLLSLAFTAMLVIGCGGAGTDQMGGPAESPEDLISAAEQLISNSNLEEILANTTGTDEAAEENAAVENDTVVADSAVIPVTEEPAAKEEAVVADTPAAETAVSDADKESTETAAVSTETTIVDESVAEPEESLEETAAVTDEAPAAEAEKEETEKEEATAAVELAYAIDSTQGKWFTAPEKELFSRETEKTVQAKIKELQKEIKEISADVKKAIKEKKENAEKADKGKDKGKADTAEVDVEAAREKIRALREEIADLRAQIGEGGRQQTGIYTAWANQSLRLNINSGDDGWYKLVVVAKNQGKLDDSYDSFSFTVLDMTDEKMLGTMAVKASDDVYNRGRLYFQLDKVKGKTLDIIWTNDYYKKKDNVTYDANVQIKQVVLKKVKEPKFLKKTRFKGSDYSYLDGRWFFEKGTAWTAWADQTIGYKFSNLKGGKYEVIVEAKNNSSLGLPGGYKEFKVEVNSDNASETVMIPAHDVKWMKGKTTIVLPEGDASIYLTWVNDSYKENEYDANISIKSIRLKRVDDSSLTAYLLRTTTGNRMMLTGVLVLLVGAIMGISFWNKKRMQATA